MRKLIAALLMLSVPSLAHAQVRIEGVWSTSEACKALLEVQRGRDTFPKGFDGFDYLRDSGMTGWEWNCDFLDRHTNDHGQAVVIASCSAEGDSWPSLFLLEKDKMAGWRVISAPDDQQTLVNEYPTQCTGVR